MMHARSLWAAAVLVAMGLLMLSTPGSKADDDKKLRDAVSKVADLVAKNDMAGAKKAAEDAVKAGSHEDLMNLMQLRNPKGGGGIGIGSKAGAIQPDGIEGKIEDLAKKALTAKELEAQGKDLERAVQLTIAISMISKLHAPDKKLGKKDPKDWKQWSDDMNAASADMAKAIKDKKPADLKKAADKVNGACVNCHTVFK